MHPKNIAAHTLLLMLLLGGKANALPSDREQPIHISSDSAQRSQKTATTTYTGNVVLDQGTLHIEADKLIITQSTDGALSKVRALGKPARLSQRPSIDKQVMRARGETIDYLPAEQLLLLIKDASIDQDGTVINSGEIKYLIAEQIVKAKTNASNANSENQRVQVVIPPAKKETPASPSKPASGQTIEKQ